MEQDEPNNKIALLQLSQRIEDKHPSLIKVSKTLNKPHPLTVQTREHWERLKKGDYSLSEKALAISVADENNSRALRFMDALIKLLEARGHSISVNRFVTKAIIFNVGIEVALREAYKRIPAKDFYSYSEKEPTGLLVLKTNQWSREKQWRDGKTQTIESMLSKIVAKLEQDAHYEIELQRKIEENRRLREIEKEKIRKQQERVDQEINRTKKLVLDSRNYTLARNIRMYLERLEISGSNIMAPDELKEYIIWAREKANWIDPLLKDNDELLDAFQLDLL